MSKQKPADDKIKKSLKEGKDLSHSVDTVVEVRREKEHVKRKRRKVVGMMVEAKERGGTWRESRLGVTWR